MAEGMTEAAFNREAAELTRKLRSGRGYLCKDGKSPEWSQWSCRNGFSRPVGKAADGLVREMHARDLLTARPGGGLMLPRLARPKTTVDIADRDGQVVRSERSEAECALDWLRSRKDEAGNPLLGEEQFAASERLRNDYTLAQMEQRVTANWEAPIEAGSGSRPRARGFVPSSDRALAAKERLHAALAQVGPELSGILLEVCCMASGLESAERLLGLPRRSGRAVLAIALTRLARHYGLIPEEAAKIPDRPLRHWATRGYRPEVS